LGSVAIALIVLACSTGAALLGIMLRKVLPERHFDSESKDAIKLVMGLIATNSGLVLGLLIASAHASFEARQGIGLLPSAAALVVRAASIAGAIFSIRELNDPDRVSFACQTRPFARRSP
jgi:hypothetical protein